MSEEDATRVHLATKDRDSRKDAWAAANGYQVLRIRWDEPIEKVLANSGLSEFNSPRDHARQVDVRNGTEER